MMKDYDLRDYFWIVDGDDAQMALVNAHLQRTNIPAITDDAQIAELKAAPLTIHTPEKVADYRAMAAASES